MRDPLIILAPPRSFTSITCAMLGQHPEMYGLPEVNLFVAETLGEAEGHFRRINFVKDGLLRAVAQLFGGEQTAQTILLAQKWLDVRFNCDTVSVFKELAEKVHPAILVDKSPLTFLRAESFQRVRRGFPQARFIHLLRHPRSYGESLLRTFSPRGVRRLGGVDFRTTPPTIDAQKVWYSLHMNIVTFLESVPESQQMRIRGEDLLTHPDLSLRQIAEWMELRTDPEAIEEMKHPERSPYACVGPIGARLGNDPDFMRQPALRPARVKPGSLDGPLSWRQDGVGFSPEVKRLAGEFGYK